MERAIEGYISYRPAVVNPALMLHVAYQGEVDNLTKRSKTSENAFLSLYKKLAEAPDPYPLLDAAVVSLLPASLSLPPLIIVCYLRIIGTNR